MSATQRGAKPRMAFDRKAIRLAVLAAAAGVALGLFSGLGERLPPDTFHVVVALANAGGPWLVTAFAVGALAAAPLAGAVAAAAALVVAVGVYYVTIYAAGNSVADLVRTAGVWVVVSALVGPLLGAAGGAWARPARPFDRIVAVALLAGTLAAEALLRLIQVETWTGIDLTRSDIQVGLIELTVAAVLPVLLLKRGERLRAYVATAAATGGAAMLAAGVLAAIRWALFG